MIGFVAATFAFDADAQRRFGGGKNLGRQSAPVQQRQATPPQQQTPQAGNQQQTPAATAAAASGRRSRSTAQSVAWCVNGAGGRFGHRRAGVVSRFRRSADDVLDSAADRHGAVDDRGLCDAAHARRHTAARVRQPLPVAPASERRFARARTNTSAMRALRCLRAVGAGSVVASGARPGSAMDQFARGNGAAGSAPWGIPAGFDSAGFLNAAKANYVKLQQAWDSGDLAELSEFTSNDMFITLTHELRARGGKSNDRSRDTRCRFAGHRIDRR